MFSAWSLIMTGITLGISIYHVITMLRHAQEGTRLPFEGSSFASRRETPKCEICLEEIQGRARTTLSCANGLDHKFHTWCITQVFENEVERTCPVCRCPC